MRRTQRIPRVASRPDAEGVAIEPVATRSDLSERVFLQVQRYKPTKSQSKIRDISIHDLVLPQVAFSDGPSQLLDRADLINALTQGICAFINRNSLNKSTHLEMRAAALAIAKFFEYGWLNRRYLLESFDKDLADELPQKLGQGGWALALRLKARIRLFVMGRTPAQLEPYLSAGDKRGDFSISESFYFDVGTNETSLSHYAKTRIAKKLGRPIPESGEPRRWRSSAVDGLTVAALLTQMQWINLLADGLEEDRLGFVPFTTPSKTSLKHGRANGRASSLGPDKVGQLLAGAFRCLEMTTPPIVRTLEDVFLAIASAKLDGVTSAKRLKKVRERSYGMSAGKAELEAVLEERVGLLVRSKEKHGTSFMEHVHRLYSACFLILAFLNARRKDELQSQVIGLHRSSLTEVDAALGVYDCEFYIEKTYKDYLSFYIGDASVRAIRALQSLADLSEQFRELVGLPTNERADGKGDPLFLMPFPHTIASEHGAIYQFKSRKGQAAGFLQSVIEDPNFELRSHMPRRAYALIFIYRYEDKDLLALAQQLGHFGLGRAYITDGPSGPNGPEARTYARPDATVAAAKQANEEADQAIAEVSAERIREVVTTVISGGPNTAGGLQRLVQRFHQKYRRRIHYSGLAAKKQIDALTESVLDRGHAFVPFAHGNCVAPQLRKVPLAACAKKNGNGVVARENASPAVCGGCTYHHLTAPHVRSLEQEASRMEADLLSRGSDVGDPFLAGAERQLGNLRRWIQIHSARLAADSAPEPCSPLS